MHLLDVAYNVVRDYPGGAPALAPQINKSPHTLNHELTARGGAKLGLIDAHKITQCTKDLRIIYALAEACGQMCLPIPSIENSNGSEILLTLGEASREFADLCKEICLSLADGVISKNELQRIERDRMELLSQLARLGTTVRMLNESGAG